MQLLCLIVGDVPELDEIAPLVLELNASALPAAAKHGQANEYLWILLPSEHASALGTGALSSKRPFEQQEPQIDREQT
jgi:hypothetical protein